jgi:hypothetical protein
VAPKLNRERIGLIGRWLAMALLVAQFGAEIHLYSHPLAESSEKLGTARNCGICLASSQLQNAVTVAVPELPARSIAWVTLVAEATAPQTRTSPFRAFRSRAPPAFV